MRIHLVRLHGRPSSVGVNTASRAPIGLVHLLWWLMARRKLIALGRPVQATVRPLQRTLDVPQEERRPGRSRRRNDDRGPQEVSLARRSVPFELMTIAVTAVPYADPLLGLPAR